MFIKNFENIEDVKKVLAKNKNAESAKTINSLLSAYNVYVKGAKDDRAIEDALGTPNHTSYSAGRINSVMPEKVIMDTTTSDSGKEYRYIWDCKEAIDSRKNSTVIMASTIKESGIKVLSIPYVDADTAEEYNAICSITGALFCGLQEVC